MSTRRLFMILAAASLTFAATALTAPAYAGPPPSEKASIAVDRTACTVTGTFAWKNYDPTTFETAHSAIVREDGSPVMITSTYDPASTPLVVVIDGVPGERYYAQGAILDGTGWTSVQSHTVTLRCR